MPTLFVFTARADFVLSDQSSPVYYSYAAAAGEEIKVDEEGQVTGNLHSNGRIDLEEGALVTGDVSAVEEILGGGTVVGGVTVPADPLELPELLDEDALRALADRIFEEDTTFEDEVIDDVVFVAGQVQIHGSINGVGTIIATEDIEIDEDDDGDDGDDGEDDGDGGTGTPVLAEGTRLSLIAFKTIDLNNDREFRGVLFAGEDIEIDERVSFEGALVAGGKIDIKNGSVVTFVDFDEEAPAITLLSPEDGSVIDVVRPEIAVAYEDDFSGLDLDTLEFLFDGVDRTSEVTRNDSLFTWTPSEDLADGVHTIEVAISDHSGKEGRESFSFTVLTDADPPVITVISPADGAVVDNPILSIVGTVVDDVGVTSVTVNGQPASLVGDTFEATVNLLPGANAIVVEASDAAGNTSSVSLTLTLEIDVTPPTLSITAPPAGVFLTESRPDIDLSFDDDDSGVDPASLVLTVNGAPLAATCNLGATGGRCSPDALLAEGSTTLAVTLSDLAGNTASASIEFIVDTVGVEIAILSPSDGDFTGDELIDVIGTVGSDVASVSVNGESATVSGGSFSATVALREGTQLVVALGTKTNGNTGTATVEITRDNVAPIVRIDSPRDGLIAVSSVIPVTGLINDTVPGPVNPTVLVNGVPAAVANGAFMLPEVALVNGPNTIEAIGTDAVGNVGRHSITVTFSPPVGVRLGLASGNGQSAQVNQTLLSPLTVAATDDFGNPVAGRLVRFEVSRNSGLLRASPSDSGARVVQVPTNGSGLAAVLLTLGDTVGEGNNRVRATATGVAGEFEFCASGVPAPADKVLMVMGDNQRGLISNPLPAPLETLVVDADGNPIAGTEVLFEVIKGSGTLDGQPTLARTTGIDGIARAVLTLGPVPGINNNVVGANVVGLTTLPASFISSGLAPADPADTRLSGVVLDNGHTPIPGARVSIDGTSLETLTDAEGQFTLFGVPVGNAHLRIDPTDSPRPDTFPLLEFETVTVAGQNNNIGQPILLPAIDTSGSQVVGGSSAVTLVMEGVEGLTLTVFPNSATFPDGQPTGRLTVSQVHLDKVPMPPPNGSIFMPPAWTIQPAGVLFDPPARITIPNDGLPIGRLIDIFQFDHALNQFINVGRGTVSDDGSVIVSDPGFGITRAGWGGCGLPPPPDTCGSGCDDGNPCTRDRCVSGSCTHTPRDGASCTDDGDDCTEDICRGTTCAHEPIDPTPSMSVNPGMVRPAAATTVTISTSPACPGVTANFRAEAVDNSGGHSHTGGRPLGAFAPGSCTTGADGMCTSQYTASAFGGEETLIATIDGMDQQGMVQVCVTGLGALGAGTNFDLIGATATHGDNHYGTGTVNGAIALIANAYRAAFPMADILHINDMSLECGGLFDYQATWAQPHQTHREGRDVDLRLRTIPAGNRAMFVMIVATNGGVAAIHNGNHYHLDF